MDKEAPDTTADEERAFHPPDLKSWPSQPPSNEGRTILPSDRVSISSYRTDRIAITCRLNRIALRKLSYLSDDLELERHIVIEEAILHLWRKHKW